MSLRAVILWIVAATAILAIPYAIAMPSVQQAIETAGVNIPTNDVAADYAWGLVWGCLLLLSIFAWPVSFRHKKMLAVGWLTKCFTAMVLMLSYEQHYSILDCWGYFRTAHGELTEILQSFTPNGTEVVVTMGALLVRIGPDSYHAVKLSFAMCGLAAIYLFFRAAETLLGRSAPAAFWIILFYPSIMFWSSIMGKDPLILLAIAIHVWGLANLAVHRTARYLWVSIAGILAVSAIRVWMGPILIAPSLLLVVSRIRNPGWRIVSIASIVVILGALGSATIERFALRETPDIIEMTRTVTGGFGRSNSALDREMELNSSWDLLRFAPVGLFDTFFRPLPGDVNNLFGVLAGIENTCLLLFVAWAAVRFRLSDLGNPVFFWSVALLLTWGAAYSIVTYKDLGTAVRFKLQVLPILIGTVGYLIRRPRRLRLLERRANHGFSMRSSTA